MMLKNRMQDLSAALNLLCNMPILLPYLQDIYIIDITFTCYKRKVKVGFVSFVWALRDLCKLIKWPQLILNGY